MKKIILLIIIILLVVFLVWFGFYNGEDGRYIGYVNSIDEKNVVFDDAVWLVGEDAINQAINQGLCTEESREECLPNDYFLFNETKEGVQYKLSSNVEVFMETYWTGEPGDQIEKIDIDEFIELINAPDAVWKHLPYYVTLKNGRVIEIREQYIP